MNPQYCSNEAGWETINLYNIFVNHSANSNISTEIQHKINQFKLQDNCNQIQNQTIINIDDFIFDKLLNFEKINFVPNDPIYKLYYNKNRFKEKITNEFNNIKCQITIITIAIRNIFKKIEKKFNTMQKFQQNQINKIGCKMKFHLNMNNFTNWIKKKENNCNIVKNYHIYYIFKKKYVTKIMIYMILSNIAYFTNKLFSNKIKI